MFGRIAINPPTMRAHTFDLMCCTLIVGGFIAPCCCPPAQCRHCQSRQAWQEAPRPPTNPRQFLPRTDHVETLPLPRRPGEGGEGHTIPGGQEPAAGPPEANRFEKGRVGERKRYRGPGRREGAAGDGIGLLGVRNLWRFFEERSTTGIIVMFTPTRNLMLTRTGRNRVLPNTSNPALFRRVSRVCYDVDDGC